MVEIITVLIIMGLKRLVGDVEDLPYAVIINVVLNVVCVDFFTSVSMKEFERLASYAMEIKYAPMAFNDRTAKIVVAVVFAHTIE